MFAQAAGQVMKTDTPILETPRSVSVVTQQQMQDRGARSLTQALQYTPGVMAGTSATTTAATGRGPRLRADDLPRRDAVRISATTTTSGRSPSCSSVEVLKGPSAMLYGNGARRRHHQRELEAARPDGAEHGRARVRDQQPLPGRHRLRRLARPTAGSSTGSSASAAAPTASSTTPTTTRRPSCPR